MWPLRVHRGRSHEGNRNHQSCRKPHVILLPVGTHNASKGSSAETLSQALLGLNRIEPNLDLWLRKAFVGSKFWF
jgi:hypothetical protein